MQDFDKAREETEELFNAEIVPEEETVEVADDAQDDAPPVVEEDSEVDVPGEDRPHDTTPEQDQQEQMLEDSMSAAEAAAARAMEMDAEINRLREQNAQLVQMNGQLQEGYNSAQERMRQLSEVQEEAVVEDVLEEPTIDFSALAFADEETQKSAQADYNRRMREFVMKGVKDELKPYIEEAERGRAAKERESAVAALENVPQLAGLRDMMPQIERIMENNVALSSPDIPIEEKIITAYAIARGVNAVNTPPKGEPTTDELMKLYESNPDFQDMVEKKRIAALESNQQVPAMSAGGGASSAALNIKEKPTSWEEASDWTRKLFGE